MTHFRFTWDCNRREALVWSDKIYVSALLTNYLLWYVYFVIQEDKIMISFNIFYVPFLNLIWILHKPNYFTYDENNSKQFLNCLQFWIRSNLSNYINISKTLEWIIRICVNRAQMRAPLYIFKHKKVEKECDYITTHNNKRDVEVNFSWGLYFVLFRRILLL